MGHTTVSQPVLLHLYMGAGVLLSGELPRFVFRMEGGLFLQQTGCASLDCVVFAEEAECVQSLCTKEAL